MVVKIADRGKPHTCRCLHRFSVPNIRQDFIVTYLANTNTNVNPVPGFPVLNGTIISTNRIVNANPNEPTQARLLLQQSLHLAVFPLIQHHKEALLFEMHLPIRWIWRRAPAVMVTICVRSHDVQQSLSTSHALKCVLACISAGSSGPHNRPNVSRLSQSYLPTCRHQVLCNIWQ